MLDAEHNAGVTLTESLAMWPGSSVSGVYYSHPQSEYFGVGKVERDQMEDYAARKGAPLAEVERWLAPILNYIPSANSNPAPKAEDASDDVSSHPAGCTCAFHLQYRKKAAQAGS